MNESTERSWEKTAQLGAKTFEFDLHEAAEIYLKSIHSSLYSISTRNEYFSL